MRTKTVKRSSRRKETNTLKGTLAGHLKAQLGKASFFPHHLQNQSLNTSSLSKPSRFQSLLDSEANDAHLPSSSPLHNDADSNLDEKDVILSQDFFCTPDYITPDDQHIPTNCNKEATPCPKSPEKPNTLRGKRYRQDISLSSLNPDLSDHQQIVELAKDTLGAEEVTVEEIRVSGSQKKKGYVSQSAIALRCRVMPPPCIMNPYLKDASAMNMDPFGNRRSKCAGFFPGLTGGDGHSRYYTDFHEIEQIGTGNFSRVFKALKRIDGCMYAVKHSTTPLHQDTERRKALMEVQALAALGSHENIVGYYSSWFENEQLYIQMELCDHSLSINKSDRFTEGEVLEAMHQIALALQFIHERGIAHLDVKLDNIYVKDGIYKLGDFGCATLLDKSLPIEEGDARYMPQEILNDNYDNLDKVDIFSLGAAMYELVRGSTLPESGPQIMNIREGKLPLLPGNSVQFQNLLKVMVDPDPTRRPSAKELVENPIFCRMKRNVKAKRMKFGN